MASTETAVMPPDDPADHNRLAGARLIVGLEQGVVLYLLYLAIDKHAWPSTNAYVMAPLMMVSVFVPLLFIQAFGLVCLCMLLCWTVAATALLALLGWLDIWRQWDSSGARGPTGGVGEMTFAMVAFTVVLLFIAQSLITAADIERRYVASYGAYFEMAR